MQPPFIAGGRSAGKSWVGTNRPGAEKNQADRMLSEPTWFYAVLGVSLKSVSPTHTHEVLPGSRR